MAIGGIYYSGGYRRMPNALIEAGVRKWRWGTTDYGRTVGVPRPALHTFWWQIEYPRRIIRHASKHARRAFQTVRKLYGPSAVPKWRPYIMMQFMSPMWEIEPEGLRAFRGKVWAEEIINLRYSKYKTYSEFAAAEARAAAQAVAQAARGAAGTAAKGAARAKAAGTVAKGALAASRAAAQAGATGAAKGVTNRIMRNRLLKRIAQGTFKFAQSKTGAFTAAVLGGLIALTIAGASYVRRNPSEVALAQLRQRRATRYPRAPSGLVFALHATR